MAPGYEPSAPPYRDHDDQFNYGAPAPRKDPFDEFPQSGRGAEAAGAGREPVLGQPEANETLGGYIFSRLMSPIWRRSHTVLRIDLRRSLAYDGPLVRKGRYSGSTPAGTVASSGGRDYEDDEGAQGARGWLSGISGGGARLKIMQVWDAPPDLLGDKKNWNITMGFGMNLELDKGVLAPKVRLKARHVALHLLPEPEFEVRGKWGLGATRMGINAKYRIPLTLGSFEDFWSDTGARLMINFYSPLNSGYHLTSGGLEFDEHLFELGEHTKLRTAAALHFPRKLPLAEGEQPFKLRVHRLGIKTEIRPGVTV